MAMSMMVGNDRAARAAEANAGRQLLAALGVDVGPAPDEAITTAVLAALDAAAQQPAAAAMRALRGGVTDGWLLSALTAGAWRDVSASVRERRMAALADLVRRARAEALA